VNADKAFASTQHMVSNSGHYMGTSSCICPSNTAGACHRKHRQKLISTLYERNSPWMHALGNSEATFCSQYALSASLAKTGTRMSKSGKRSSSAYVMRTLLPASSASLLTVSLMHGAQAGAMPSEQGPLTIKGAHAALEVVTGKAGEGLSTF
jgi:hypothetical protein